MNTIIVAGLVINGVVGIERFYHNIDDASKACLYAIVGVCSLLAAGSISSGILG